MYIHACTNKMSIGLPLFPLFSCYPAGSVEVHGCPAAESLEISEPYNRIYKFQTKSRPRLLD